jgi:hypothetical protein
MTFGLDFPYLPGFCWIIIRRLCNRYLRLCSRIRVAVLPYALDGSVSSFNSIPRCPVRGPWRIVVVRASVLVVAIMAKELPY